MAKKKHKNPALSNERPTWGLIEKLVLWSKCAGRCELCNQLLYENKYTKNGKYTDSEQLKAKQCDFAEIVSTFKKIIYVILFGNRK